jgi:hypothetical protein
MAKLKRFEPATVVVRRIFEHYEEEGKKEPRRTYLGASVLGEKCDRRLWYDFRWCGKEDFEGRMLALLATGDLEEERMKAELRAIGVEVDDKDAQGEQHAVSFLNGHGGGHLDALLRNVPEEPNPGEQIGGEFKTHNAKNFAELSEKGVERSHPKHFVQMQIYMGEKKLRHFLYLGKNKDNDGRHAEFVAFNEKVHAEQVGRGRLVVAAQKPPERISDNPEVPPCCYTGRDGTRYPCPHLKICHQDAIPNISCRTCLHSTPEDDGTWSCARHKKTLSFEEQEAACDQHLYIPAVLPFGKPIDADNSFVLYPQMVMNLAGGEIKKP